MNKVFELEPGEKIFWHAEVDEDILKSDREFVKQTERKAYYLFPIVVLMMIPLVIWLGDYELNLTTIITSSVLFIICLIFGFFDLKKRAKEKTHHNPYEKDVVKFVLTQKRFLYLNEDGKIVGECRLVDQLKLRDHRKRRSLSGAYINGLAFYRGIHYLIPDIFIWGLDDFDKATHEIQNALDEIKAENKLS